MTHPSIRGAACLAVLTLAAAAPLKAQGHMPRSAQLPAETTILVHVDIQQAIQVLGLGDKIRREYRNALGEIRSEPEAEKLIDLLERFDLDPTRDLHAVTVYGNEKRENAAVMLTVSSRFDRVTDWLDDERVARERERDGVTYRSLSTEDLAAALDVDADGLDEDVSFVVRRDGDVRRVLFAEDNDELVRAARALDGRGRTADQDDKILRRRPEGAAMIHAEIATSFEDLVRDTPASGIASRIERVSLRVTEQNDDLRIAVELQTGSRKDADAIASVLNGLRGLLQMIDEDQLEDEDVPVEVLEAVRELRAEAEGERVVMKVRLPLDMVRSRIQEEIRDVKIR